jgi:hypothetical protein
VLIGSQTREEGESLLSFAIHRLWGDGVALFLQYGADPSPGDLAEMWLEPPVPANFLYLLALLGDHPVDWPLSDPDRTPINTEAPTALMYAAQHDEAYAVRFLVESRGADPRLRDSDGHNALFYLMKHIESTLLHRWRRLAQLSWRADNEEALREHEKNIFAALIGPTDAVPYEKRVPETVARLRETVPRHHLWLDSVGHTRLRASAAAVRMPSPFGRSSGGLHCSVGKRPKP